MGLSNESRGRKDALQTNVNFETEDVEKSMVLRESRRHVRPQFLLRSVFLVVKNKISTSSLASYMYRRIWHWVYPERHAAHSRNWCRRHSTWQKKYDAKRFQQPTRKLADLLHVCERHARMAEVRIGNRAAIKKVYARAQELRQWFDVVVDHKIPLSKGGAHASRNLQIIYRHENQQKGNRLDYTPTIIFS